MTVQHSVPSQLLVPGNYFQFNIAAAARGLTPLDRRVANIGTMSSGGSAAPLVPVQVFSEGDADEKFGVRSPLAVMCKWSLRGGVDYGTGAELWAVPQEAAGGAVAATHTLTITGTTDGPGDSIIEISGIEIRASVDTGTLVADHATALRDAINEQAAELTVSATAAAGVVTLTAEVAGANGNDLVVTVKQAAPNAQIVAAAGVSGTGVVDITAALDALATDEYDWLTLENHGATDVSDLAAHMAEMWEAGTKRWRFSLIGETGSLATVDALATAADDFKQAFIWSEDNPIMPGNMAAYVGMMYAARAPTLTTTLNGQATPRLPLPPKASWPQPGLAGEQQAALAGGVGVIGPNKGGTSLKIVRAVTSKTTHNGQPYKALIDTLVPEGMVYIVKQAEISWAKYEDAKKSLRVRNSIRSDTLKMLKAAEELEVIQNVDALKGELTVEPDPLDVNAAVAAIPADVIPGLAKLIGVLNLRVS